LQDKVEVPEPPVIEVTVRLQLIPLAGDVTEVRMTVPTNPFAGPTVIVEFSVELTFPGTLVGFAAILKSWITKVALVEWERVPLVPVIVSAYVPAADELQETLAAFVLVTLGGEIEPQFRPAGRESVRATVPVNPFKRVMEIVEVARRVTLTGPGEEAVMLKSVTVIVALAEWDIVPLEPVMLKLYVPAVVELHATVAVPDPAIVAGVIPPQVRPDNGVSVRLTDPVNPFRAVTVIDVVAEVPIVAGEGEVAEMLKSDIEYATVAEWDSAPLVAVIVAA
jgi:hypothetical protein